MIQIQNISPSKNSTDVSIVQDLEIVINADFELDPRNVSFKLNNVDIIPNVFSVYQGASVYELIITLYTRKRIKYGKNKRYGQDLTRYGMRDVHPSILEYGSRYVCEFTVWGENETLTDSFVFTTEPGIFYNSSPADYFYSTSTQALANYYPDWSKTRYDKYSNAQQLLNPIGENLEKISELVVKEKANNFIQTSDLNELSALHRIELDKDFEIESILNEDGSFFYVQPEITAIQNITRFDLFTDQNNDLRGFYKDKLPTRLGSSQVSLPSNLMYGPEIIQEYKMEVDQTLSREGGFCISVEGLDSSMKKTDSEKIVFSQCRVWGVDIFGDDQEEDLIILGYQNNFSRKLWKKVNYLQFSNLPKTEVTFKLFHFREKDTPIIGMKQEVQIDDTIETIIWTLDTRFDRSILQKNKTLGDNNYEIMRNSGLFIPIQELELLDINGHSSLQLKDIAIDKFSNYVYGIDDNFLYIFDKREEYPKILKQIKGVNGNADLLLEIDSDETGLDESGEKEILFKCIHRKPGQTVLRYRIQVTKPDGSKVYILEDGQVISNKSQAMIFITQEDLILEDKQYSFILDNTGDYILELEALYKGGGTSVHQQLVRVLSASAKVKYKLEKMLNDSVPHSLVIDHDQKLKILTEDKVLHTVLPRRDGVLIDYDNKILYFSEEYSSVDVG